MALQAAAYSHEKKATKSEEKQSKSVAANVSANKEEKKGYSCSKATKTEEKQFKSSTVKVYADKEDKKGYSGSKSTKP